MLTIFEFKSIRLFLNAELTRRKKMNPQYSLRAFARDLKISYSRLSEILSHESTISVKTMNLIAEGVKLTDMEKLYLEQIVNYQTARSAKDKKQALKKMKSFAPDRNFKVYKSNYEILLGHWYMFPLLEMITSPSSPSRSVISKKLKISEVSIDDAVKVLEKNGIIILNSNTGKYKKSKDLIKVESKIPSRLIREFHKNYLQKASRAIDQQPIEKRKFLTAVLRVNEENLLEIKNEIENFHQKLIKKYTKQPQADSIYSFQQQFFAIGES